MHMMMPLMQQQELLKKSMQVILFLLISNMIVTKHFENIVFIGVIIYEVMKGGE